MLKLKLRQRAFTLVELLVVISILFICGAMLLTDLFVILKLTGVIAWGWAYVLLPVIILLTLSVGGCCLGGIGIGIYILIEMRRGTKRNG
jgi:prepilin-type N-terminal cleavage/methylation domain-containing protein